MATDKDQSGTSTDAAGSDAGPIARIPLHDAVAGRLRDMIIEGVLEPGARIHETHIGAQLGVSRTPLREAIKFLASEGLIELIPARGAIVRVFSKKDVADMLTVLRSLESLAGKLACENGSDRDIRAIRKIHDQMLVYYKQKRRLEYYKLNQEIHSAIVRLADNEHLAYLHGILQSRLKRIRFIGHEGPTNWASAVEEHEEIIAALEARDTVRLMAILDRHLLGAWERVEAII
ncbi:GntR family transcriptional regulator [Phyllobacterium sp. 628]|uniref:GntR family transcriptional regulator n=1 Tax=Phyllobacterium sp. 628 TaxID=2718938 RepID=UPI001FCF28F0|nr:GntR family transcriptional regulator [Phyllobacterium sp. 628]